MPIRTRRGRSAAYRALWEWPLRSPRRLLSCLAVLLAVGLAASLVSALLAGARTGSSAAALPGATQPPTASSSPPVPPSIAVAELDPPSLPLSAAPQPALDTAVNWTLAWSTHPQGTSTEQWLAGLAPYTTDEFLGTLSTVDPTNVPGSRVTGPAVAVEVHQGSVRATVPTDGPVLRVLVVDTGAGDWKVAGYDRAP